MGHKKHRGHFCWCCGAIKPNEAFSGHGHGHHLCKACSKLGPAELAYRQVVRDIDRLLGWDGLVRRKAEPAFAGFLKHPDDRVRAYATRIAANAERIRAELATESRAIEASELTEEFEPETLPGGSDSECPF